MATTFESFGGDFGSRQNVFSGKPGSAESFLQGIPPELIGIFNQLAESGIFGEGGIEELFRSISRQGSLERNRLAKGLRQGSLGRRLGPRSGAIDNLIANKVFAPSFAGTESAKRNLLVQNQQSKLLGVQGIQDLLGFFQNQFALEEEVGSQGPGVLDFVGPGLDIAGAFGVGVPGQGSAVTSVAGQGNRPRGPV